MCVQGTGCGTDVDHGDPRALLEQFAAWADLPSRRGRHAYYDDDTPRANATWAALGCRGDIRGAKGYLVLHEDGCERLAEALDHRVPGTRPFPRDLFDLGLGDPAVASAPVPTLKRGPLLVRDAGAVVDLPLDRVWPGARHNTTSIKCAGGPTPKRAAMTCGRGLRVSSPTRSDRMSGSPCRSLRLTHWPRRAAWRPGYGAVAGRSTTAMWRRRGGARHRARCGATSPVSGTAGSSHGWTRASRSARSLGRSGWTIERSERRALGSAGPGAHHGVGSEPNQWCAVGGGGESREMGKRTWRAYQRATHRSQPATRASRSSRTGRAAVSITMYSNSLLTLAA